MKWLTLALILLALAGCWPPTRAELQQQRLDERNAEIRQGVGRRDYDYYLQNYGPPNDCAPGDKIFVCQWGLTQPRSSISFFGNTAVSRTRTVGWQTRLVFDAQTRLLLDGQYQEF